MKSTALAPSNIAFIKYWGKKSEKLRLPTNNSISMNLDSLLTTTTVEFSPKFSQDEVIIDSIKNIDQQNRVVKHLNRVRKLAKIEHKAKVVSINNFPQSTGLSSSASGFAALTLACVNAAGLKCSKKELTKLSRLGSGSSCRSIPDGFVEWLSGSSHDSSYATSLYKPDHWEIFDVVAIVSLGKKDISTSKAMKNVYSSLFFSKRLLNVKNRIRKIKQAIKNKNLAQLGKLIEEEALEMHAIMLTQNPYLIYWLPQTLKLIKLVREWRKQAKIKVYFTLNTGQDVHLITNKSNIDKVKILLKSIEEVKQIIINKPSSGARLINNHLF